MSKRLDVMITMETALSEAKSSCQRFKDFLAQPIDLPAEPVKHDGHVQTLLSRIADLQGELVNSEAFKAQWDGELPTEAELEYYDSEAEKVAIQFNFPQGKQLPMEEISDIVALPETSLMRMTMFVDGQDYEGEWQPKDLTVLGYTVKLAARKGLGFSVQFKGAEK